MPEMVSLSKEKRLRYEQFQPQFWRHARNAETAQSIWFASLLSQDIYLMYIAYEAEEIKGFIIGELQEAPEVYDPGGLTLVIDDFCVLDESLWSSCGALLLDEILKEAKKQEATQVVVVCGAEDTQKRSFLKHQDLCTASEWYVKGI